MELFTFSKKVGQGLPLWLPKGAVLRDKLEEFLKIAQTKAGYLQLSHHILATKTCMFAQDIMKNMERFF